MNTEKEQLIQLEIWKRILDSKSFSWMIFELCLGQWLGICQAEKGKERHDGIKENYTKNLRHKDDTESS